MTDWDNKLNMAIEHIENNLCGDINFETISRITLCPVDVLQRFFVLNTGITLTEYIRRRRLSEAAHTIISTNKKIIDIALEFGYETPDAFRVAFKRIFGVTPMEARKSKSIDNLYLRIAFSVTIYRLEE